VIGQCLGYRRRNSHVKRFADAFEALAVARFAFVGEKDMTRPSHCSLKIGITMLDAFALNDLSRAFASFANPIRVGRPTV
jgi:hypothetical protein